MTADGRNVGGGIIESIESCHTKREVQHGVWEITFDSPNTFEPGDGLRFYFQHTAPLPSGKAMNQACLWTLAHMLLRGPWQVWGRRMKAARSAKRKLLLAHTRSLQVRDTTLG